MWQTGKLAKYLGVDRSVLHYYDSEGIIRAKKSENSYRSYDSFDLIALWEARHFRTMGFSLGETVELLRNTDQDSRLQMLEAKEQDLQRQIQLLEATKFLTQTAQGKHRPVSRTLGELTPYDYGGYYYLPLESHSGHTKPDLDFAALAEMVRDAPYINYCYHFPLGSCTSAERFSHELGVSFQEWWREYAPEGLPQGIVHRSGCPALTTLLTTRSPEMLFSYEDFEFVRLFCAENSLVLTGEAMAFPSIYFYDHEMQTASFHIYFFLEP